MTNLTEISMSIRKFIIWFVIVSIIYFLLQIFFNIGKNYWIASHPIPTPTPNTRFGKLPRISFSGNSTSSGEFVFTLENIEGKPPDTTASAKIYSMPKKQLGIMTENYANSFASKLGFTLKGEPLNTIYYSYTDPNNPLITMLLNIVTLNYEIKYDYTQNPDNIFKDARFTKEEVALNEIKSYLTTHGMFDSNVLNGSTNIQLLKYNPLTKNFDKVGNISSADTMRVNFIRENLQGLKILPPDYNNSYNYVLYSPSNTVKYLRISYTFWPIDYNDFATYPLKSSNDAWKELNEGFGIVANIGQNPTKNITIRSIYLAYYDSEDPESYLQPIFVFEGDNNFAAYIPAVSSDWIE
jgi:hypothetical protein